MAGNIGNRYGSSNQALTWTLASLSASATVGRQATAVASGTAFEDAIVQGLIETGTVSGNKQVLFYVAASADGGTSYGGKNGGNAIGASDAGFTRADPTDLVLLGVLPTPSNSTIYGYGPYSIAKALGYYPDHWVVIAFNDTGAALSATAGNNKGFYQEIGHQYT